MQTLANSNFAVMQQNPVRHVTFKPLIISVSDNALIRRTTTFCLESAGFAVIEADNNAAAIELILQHKPHLALIYLKHDSADDFDVCRGIRDHPRTAPLPIIKVSTLHEDPEQLPGRLEGGPDIYFEESSGPLALVATIRSILQLQLANRIARDAEHKLADMELLMQSHHDHLTGLPDRNAFTVSLAKALAASLAEGCWLALFYLDLDGFKLMSRRRCGQEGDEILVGVAQRLRDFAGPGGCVARVAGDEFAVFLTGEGDESAVQRISENLLRSFDESLDVNGDQLFITSTIGISVYPRDGNDSEQLMYAAEAAMYQGRRQGKNRYQFFTSQMAQSVRDRDNLERHLRGAVENGRLSLCYQPQIALDSKSITRYEALLRWDHPIQGPIAPDRFIPIAEESGLILSIGAWTLEQACLGALSFPDSTARVAVNVSAIQLLRPDFMDIVAGCLEFTGLAADRLEIELTESALIGASEELLTILYRLRDLGVSITVDNFGAGYLSLHALRKLPVNGLKIDRVFAQQLGADPDARSLLRSVVSLAHSLKLRAAIHGIETENQLNALVDTECDEAQGYFFGKPAALASN